MITHALAFCAGLWVARYGWRMSLDMLKSAWASAVELLKRG